MAARKAEAEPLRREAIVAEAIALADKAGLGALTMRKLAARLGYEVMSLYNHVANKDELLSLMVEAVVAEVDEPPPDLPPLETVRRLAVATRETYVRHPWAADLWLRQMPGPARTRHMELLLDAFARSGLSPELAHHGYHAVTNHVLGYTLQELGMTLGVDEDEQRARIDEFLTHTPEDTYPRMVEHVRQHLEGHTASSFELVLDLILDGLVRLDAGA